MICSSKIQKRISLTGNGKEWKESKFIKEGCIFNLHKKREEYEILDYM